VLACLGRLGPETTAQSLRRPSANNANPAFSHPCQKRNKKELFRKKQGCASKGTFTFEVILNTLAPDEKTLPLSALFRLPITTVSFCSTRAK
jgi:hypothetical protein